MNITLDSALLSRLKKLKKMIRKGDEPKPFRKRCKTVKGILSVMIAESVSKWEFIHDYPGREQRREKFLKEKKHLLKNRKKKNKKKKHAADY